MPDNSTPFSAAVMLSLVLIVGCASNRGGEAPTAYLQPTGWQHPDNALQAESFTDYATIVRAEVQRYRVPVDPNAIALEVDMASPLELKPAASCEGRSQGIALLVHGLSDTAFAMRDIGHVLTQACLTVRTVLLPGHGTRAGDLLTTRYKHWQDTVDYLIAQAASESEYVVVGGFSLGAVLALESAVQQNSSVDALLAFSPAYYLSSYRLARWAPLLHPLKPWIDRGIADDSMRYEAMPTRGVAETVKSMKAMHALLKSRGAIEQPWLMVQSMDDAVTVPVQQLALFERYATHPESMAINFYTKAKPAKSDARLHWLPGNDEAMRVRALTHQAVHISPDNPHYGLKGNYRNCGSTGPRNADAVTRCENVESVWYELWGNRSSEDDTKPASAISTFNPHFEQLSTLILQFLHNAGTPDS